MTLRKWRNEMAQKKRMASGKVLKEGERERPNGTFEFRWKDRFGKRHSIYAETLSQLREKEDELNKNDYEELKKDSKRMTLNAMYTRWKKVKKGLKDNTFQNYQYMYEKYVWETFGNVKVVELRRSDVKEFYNQLHENGMKAATIDCIHTVIHQVLELAVDDDIIRYNPSDKALKELMSENSQERKKVKALTMDEQVLFVNYLRNSSEYQRWYPIFVTMLMTGMRLGETIALQWDDIDFENDQITVNKTLVFYEVRSTQTCRYAINTTKTRAGERKIEMIQMVKDALLLEKKQQKALGITCQANVDGYDNFIFLNRFGLVYNHTTLNHALRRIVKDCNEEIILNSNTDDPLLLPKIHCHMLRHTYGTRLNDANVNIKAMQALMGHADIETTMEVYVDASKETLKSATTSYEKLVTDMFNTVPPVTPPLPTVGQSLSEQ